jgi:hypothetical protein
MYSIIDLLLGLFFNFERPTLFGIHNTGCLLDICLENQTKYLKNYLIMSGTILWNEFLFFWAYFLPLMSQVRRPKTGWYHFTYFHIYPLCLNNYSIASTKEELWKTSNDDERSTAWKCKNYIPSDCATILTVWECMPLVTASSSLVISVMAVWETL